MATEPGEPNRWRRSAEAFRAWAPLVISICAISLTIFQATAARRHTRLSVQPRLDYRVLTDGETGEVRVSLVNVGLGPAILTDVTLRCDGDELGEVGVEACDAMDRRIGRGGDGWTTACFDMEGEYVVPARDEVVLYASRPAPGLSAQARQTAEVDYARLGADGRYCSFYEECWRIDDR